MMITLLTLVSLTASFTPAWAAHTHTVKDEARMTQLQVGSRLKFHEPIALPGGRSVLRGSPCDIVASPGTEAIGVAGAAGEYVLTGMTLPIPLLDEVDDADCTRIVPERLFGRSCIIGTVPADARVGARVNLYFQSLTGEQLSVTCPLVMDGPDMRSATLGELRASFLNNPYILQNE